MLKNDPQKSLPPEENQERQIERASPLREGDPHPHFREPDPRLDDDLRPRTHFQKEAQSPIGIILFSVVMMLVLGFGIGGAVTYLVPAVPNFTGQLACLNGTVKVEQVSISPKSGQVSINFSASCATAGVQTDISTQLIVIDGACGAILAVIVTVLYLLGTGKV